jgi:hypothetical protein
LFQKKKKKSQKKNNNNKIKNLTLKWSAHGRWAVCLGGRRSVGGGGGQCRFGKWVREREVVCGGLRGTMLVGGRRSVGRPFSGQRSAVVEGDGGRSSVGEKGGNLEN